MLELIGRVMKKEVGSGREVFMKALTDAGFVEEYEYEEEEQDDLGTVAYAQAVG